MINKPVIEIRLHTKQNNLYREHKCIMVDFNKVTDHVVACSAKNSYREWQHIEHIVIILMNRELSKKLIE